MPKADLERENQLENIKSLAGNALDKHQKLFSVPHRPSLSVYVVAWIVHNWRRQYWGMLLGCAVLTLFLYWIFFPNGASESEHSPWLLVLAPAFIFVVEVLYYVRNFYFANWAQAAREIEIMSDGVSYRTATVCWLILYRRLKGSHEYPWAFHVYFDAKSLYLIPKRDMSTDQIAQLRQLLSAPR